MVEVGVMSAAIVGREIAPQPESAPRRKMQWKEPFWFQWKACMSVLLGWFSGWGTHEPLLVTS
jgi:hypothetical protein